MGSKSGTVILQINDPPWDTLRLHKRCGGYCRVQYSKKPHIKNLLPLDMKKIILLLSLALLIGCKVQEKPQVLVDPILWVTVQEFVSDARNNGVDPSVLNDSLSYITILPLRDNLYGIYTPKNRQVAVNVFVPLDKYILRKVIYHELGHVLGLEHDVHGLMSTGLMPLQIHNKYCPSHNPVGEENWELHKIIFFRKIRDIQVRGNN